MIDIGPPGGDQRSCTAGFPVHSSSGHHYLLTAAHCAEPNGGGEVYTYSGTYIGPVAGWSDSVDAMVVNSDAGYNSELSDGTIIIGDSYGGDWADLDPVTGAGTAVVGDGLCQSGAFTGTVCALIVDAVDQTTQLCDENGENCSHYTNENHAVIHPDVEGPAAGLGDSGGLVYDPLGPDYTAIAEGTVSGINGELVDCIGDTSPGQQCRRGMWFTDLFAGLGEYGYTLTTITAGG